MMARDRRPRKGDASAAGDRVHVQATHIFISALPWLHSSSPQLHGFDMFKEPSAVSQ
jgi:hypothetical protein